MDMLNSLRMLERSAVAQQRLKRIELHEHYGEKATKEAFDADRKLIWRKRQNYFHQPQGRVYHAPESKWLHTTWIATSLFAMSGNQFADVVQKGLAYLLTRPSSEWEASQLSWALNCLSKTGLPKEQQFIARCLRQLLDRCNPDGTWTSEDGPVFAVGATIEALKVLYHYGLI